MSDRHPDENRLSTADVAAGVERERSSRWSRAPEGGDQAAGDTAGRSDTVDAATPDSRTEERTPLFPSGEASNFQSRWSEVQTGFVDDPRRAVEEADTLVAEVIERLASTFASERDRLEEQWSRGDDVSTEELRVALQRYRSFFDRLLSV